MGNFLPKDYVGVHVRVDQFHDRYPQGSITTEFTVSDGLCQFRAVVTCDVSVPSRVFTGSSFGELKKEKALEKLETVAVGRALAFAGFETQSGIASKEEMQKFSKKEVYVDTPRDDEKPQFSQDDFERLSADITIFSSFEEAIKIIKDKWEVSPDREVKIKNLLPQLPLF